MRSTIILLVFLCCVCATSASAAGLFLLTRRGTASGSVPSPATTLTDGRLYTLSRDGVFLANDFDASRPKGRQCNASTTATAGGASILKLTKEGEHWIVGTDCDGDGSYTSYLTYGDDLIEAKTSDTTLQRWSIACDASGCSFKNANKGTYLSGSLAKPTWSTSPLAWSFVPVT